MLIRLVEPSKGYPIPACAHLVQRLSHKLIQLIAESTYARRALAPSLRLRALAIVLADRRA